MCCVVLLKCFICKYTVHCLYQKRWVKIKNTKTAEKGNPHLTRIFLYISCCCCNVYLFQCLWNKCIMCIRILLYHSYLQVYNSFRLLQFHWSLSYNNGKENAERESKKNGNLRYMHIRSNSHFPSVSPFDYISFDRISIVFTLYITYNAGWIVYNMHSLNAVMIFYENNSIDIRHGTYNNIL